MSRLLAAVAALVLAALLAMSSVCVVQAADPAQGLSREATEEIIRDYLLKNPEIVDQALRILDERQRKAEKQETMKALAAHQEDLLSDPLGPDSELAARAALAAHAQGKYAALHDAMLAASGPLTMRAILKLAGPAGVDVAKLQADIETPEIRATIERDRSLAEAIGITGTPSFVIGSELVPGRVDLATLKALVAEARAKAAPPSR